MKIEEFILNQFSKTSVKVRNISVINESSRNFGDFAIEVESDIGKLKILKDRGQVFVDVFDFSSGKFIPAEKVCDPLLDIYSKATWELSEIINALSSNQTGTPEEHPKTPAQARSGFTFDRLPQANPDED